MGGALNATTCIHAVGPQYSSHRYGGDLERADTDLRSTYLAALSVAESMQLATVGFSLISAGIYRKPRSLESVLEIGLEAIVDGGRCEVHAPSSTTAPTLTHERRCPSRL